MPFAPNLEVSTPLCMTTPVTNSSSVFRILSTTLLYSCPSLLEPATTTSAAITNFIQYLHLKYFCNSHFFFFSHPMSLLPQLRHYHPCFFNLMKTSYQHQLNTALPASYPYTAHNTHHSMHSLLQN